VEIVLDLLNIADIYNSISKWILPMLVASLMGLFLQIALYYSNQRWVTTFQHTMSFLLLPVITFTITKVISGSIPLALGMVGALSIVRFRHPVKNSFELIMYFALITIGIACSTRLIFGVGLTSFIIFILILTQLYKIFLESRGKNFFNYSFSEAENNYLIEVVLSNENNQIRNIGNLLNEYHDNIDETFTYRLSIQTKKEALEALDFINKNFKNEIKNISADFS
jgi:hypothetical protein